MRNEEPRTTSESAPPAATHQTDEFCCSHALRLSGREWLVVLLCLLALILLAPVAWTRIERFHPGRDYRVPYKLSNDYWHYRRYCRRMCAEARTPVIGDSVVWGHYVAPDETLSHYLNELLGGERFANLGLDGTHPAALSGLLKHYADAAYGRAVLLHFNPLWMTSRKHDLQTIKEFRFNHPKLVPQFRPKIPCYRASFSTRLWTMAEQYVPFFSWTSHVRCAYWEDLGLPVWTLKHPYVNPLSALHAGLAQPEPAGEQVPPRRAATQTSKHDLDWVNLEESLQWRFFQRSVTRLQKSGCDVLVLVGPFNEHVLSDADVILYGGIKREIGAWLESQGVSHFIPVPLPAAQYADASHPIATGYALLARQLLEAPSFRAWTARNTRNPDPP